MLRFATKYSLPVWISLVLVAGFLTTTVAGYLVSLESIRRGLAEQSLPLTSDNIYSEIQRDLLRPVFISSLMAQDTFVRDWVLHGERDTKQIVRYLREVKLKYGAVVTFLVSAHSSRYYYDAGTLKSVRTDEPRDKWFYRVAAMQQAYETNVDFDMANRDRMTVFINYRVLDYSGNFIAATGVGLALDTVSRIIDSYQARYQREIYFVDDHGTIIMTGKSDKAAGTSIRTVPGLRDVAAQVISRSTVPTRLEYQDGPHAVLLNSRYIPELGWYLLVEQDVTEAARPVQRIFLINLGISAAVTLLVLSITLFAVRRYQRRIEQVAATDLLTGMLNRHAFDIVYNQAVLEFQRTRRPLAAILFDIDTFKQINDRYGHLAGDEVIRTVARLTRETVRESDIPARWGGEEFIILLKDCTLAHALTIAEKLRSSIAAHDFGSIESGMRVTVSLGVAEYAADESQNEFFARTDAALYQAKSRGRNRTESLQPGELVASA